MEMTLIPVGLDNEKVLVNLMEKYEYEFSQYHQWDVHKSGLFGCYLEDEYKEENGKYAAFLIEVDGKLAGFIMVGDGVSGDRKTDYQVNEMFVMYKYRRLGIGKKALFEVLETRKGTWQVLYHPDNKASACFWERTADLHINGKHELVVAHSHEDYSFYDDTQGNVIYF